MRSVILLIVVVIKVASEQFGLDSDFVLVPCESDPDPIKGSNPHRRSLLNEQSDGLHTSQSVLSQLESAPDSNHDLTDGSLWFTKDARSHGFNTSDAEPEHAESSPQFGRHRSFNQTILIMRRQSNDTSNITDLNPINDSNPDIYPKQSNPINTGTLFLVIMPVGFSVFLVCVGFLVRQPFCFEAIKDVLKRVSPIEPEDPAQQGGQDDDDGEEEEGDNNNKKGPSKDNNKDAITKAREAQRNKGDWTLDIRVLQARNLPASDIPILDSFLVGLADPYATIGLRNKRREAKTPYQPIFQTEIKKSTLHPVWNEGFRTEFSGTEDEISIQVWDKDLLKPDDYLGEALIPTKRLIDEFHRTRGEVSFGDAQWYELYDRKGRVVKGGRARGARSEDVGAVELQFKLDKTYDPVKAVGDMKSAIEDFRVHAAADEAERKRRERQEEADRERNKARQKLAVRASALPPDVKARSQALAQSGGKSGRQAYMDTLPASSKHQGVAKAPAKKKKKKAAKK